MKKYFVYVIRTSEAVKVGYSCNPWARLKAIQTGNVQQCNLIFVSKSLEGVQRAKSLESRTHKKLGRHHVRGEWFALECLDDLKKQGFSRENLSQISDNPG